MQFYYLNFQSLSVNIHTWAAMHVNFLASLYVTFVVISFYYVNDGADLYS